MKYLNLHTYLNSLIILIALIFSISCTSTGTKNDVDAAGSAKSAPFLYSNIDDIKNVNFEQCPSSDTTWRKERVEKLIQYANACFALKNHKRVTSLGNHISTVHHTSPWGPYYLALSAQEEKAYDRALWMIELAIKKTPQNSLFYYQRARIYWEMGHFKTALESFEASLKYNNKMKETHLFLAQLYFRDGKYNLAENHFEKLMQYYPDFAVAFVGLAEARLATKRNSDVIKLYEQAVQHSPRNIHYRVRLSNLYETIEADNNKALQSYKKVLELMVSVADRATPTYTEVQQKVQKLESQLTRSVSGEKNVLSQTDEVKRVNK